MEQNKTEQSQTNSVYSQLTKNFRLIDDDFMTLVFGGNIEATQLLLRIILEDSELMVTETIGQFEIKNPNGRSVRLDIHAVDSKGENSMWKFSAPTEEQERSAHG